MWFAPWRVERAESCLTAMGYTVSYGQRAFAVSPDGLRAGTPQERAADFMDAVVDPDVDAILSAHSAVGSREVIPFLDARTIAEHRKPFIGNCDNVFLHEFLAARAGLSSYYGATYLEHFGEVDGAFPETVEYFTAAVTTDLPLTCRPVPSRTRDWFNWYTRETEGESRRRTVAGGWSWIRPGRAVGRLLGGELSLLADLLQSFPPSREPMVLFWDLAAANDRPPTAQLAELGQLIDLTGLAGMIVGAHWVLDPPDWAAAVTMLLDEVVPAATYPVVVNSDLSHLSPTWIVPYGEKVRVDSEAGIVFPREGLGR
jgi:muramoyltetrapeptide carboxypeptidase LdcA involved in peptidoglycan recycling